MASVTSDLTRKRFYCDFSGCDKSYTRFSHLVKHKEDKHGFERQSKENMKCHLCPAVFSRLKVLITHLNKDHNYDIQIKEFLFPSIEAFHEFKMKEEHTKKSSYVTYCGKSKNLNIEKQYYYCHRSGFSSESFSNRIRNFRSSRSFKSEGFCIAHMVVKVDEVTKRVHLSYVDQHSNHEIKEKFVKLSKVEKYLVASMALEGKSSQDIFKYFAINNQIKKLSIQKIENIKKKFNVGCKEQLHSDEHISMKMHAESDKNILALKWFDEKDNNFPFLDKHDFLMIYFNKLQGDYFKKCLDGPYSCVCMDATHGMTHFPKIKLVTLLCIDEFHQGTGIAFLASNREDRTVLTYFLNIIKEQLGVLVKLPDFFMSDMAHQYYQAWSSVFGSITRKLICSWHVDKNWKGS